MLVDCPRLRGLQIKLRREVRDVFNNISSLLEGLTHGKKGNPDIISRAKMVNAMLDFAKAS
jgi:hypothetical protein